MIFVVTLGDVVGISLAALMLVALLVWAVATWIRTSRCEHDGGVRETPACDAICNKCGKNLGFIGSWRKP